VEYGSLTELLGQVEKVGGKVGDSLRANVENVKRNRELTQLLHDAPIEFTIDALAWSGVKESDLTDLFEQLEFRTLKDRLKVISTGEPTTEKKSKKEAEPEFSLFGSDIDSAVLTAEEASAKIASHSGPISIAYELNEDRLHRYAVALDKKTAFLVHSSDMGEWATDAAVQKIAHDAKTVARENGLTGVVFDTSLAAYLVILEFVLKR
jgi:DNA polymerase-1